MSQNLVEDRDQLCLFSCIHYIFLLTLYLAVCFADTCGFKQSTQKRDETLQFIPCNLHLQRMRVQSQGNGGCVHAVEVEVTL